jgi:glyoxylase-like metal-dependent hydrolase (beta-lactamase superfamily II)
MTHIVKIVGLVIALLVVLALAVVAPAFLGRRSVPEGVEINGIRIVKDGMVSVSVVPIGEREVALIDAGNDASGRPILEELSRRGLDPDAVRAILLTHGHPDHVAAIAAFPKARVMALAREVDLIEGRAAARGLLARLMPARPTGIKAAQSLQDGETVTLAQTQIRVFAVSGHTAGSAAYLVRDVLFLGDAADVGGDGTIQPAPWIFSDSQAEDRASLVGLYRRLVRDGATVKAIVCAHSGAITEGLAPLAAFARSGA